MGKEISFEQLIEEMQSGVRVSDEQPLRQLEHSLATTLNITRSLRRCAELAKRNPAKTTSGLTRAFHAAKKRIKEI